MPASRVTGRLTLWVSHQAPHQYRTILAQMRLGLDRAEIRRRNLTAAGAFPYRTASHLLYDAADYRAALDRALELSGYAVLRARRGRHAARYGGRRLLGVGVCMYTELAGMGPSPLMGAIGNRQGGYETVIARLDATGRVTVLRGIIEIGQGIRASLAQIAADVLTVDPATVRVVLGDTDLSPYSSYGTADSRGSVTAGTAALRASRLLRDKVVHLAAYLLEASVDDVDLIDGRCVVRGTPGRSLSLAEVAREGYRGQKLPAGMEPGMEARFTYHPDNWTFPYGAHVAAVDVDVDLGTVDVVGYWVAHECGMVINPMLVEGQLQGAIAQGNGGALLEELRYDEDGQLLTSTLMDYLLPTITESPRAVIAHLPSSFGAMSERIKGVAEGGTIAAPAAIASAVADALMQISPDLASAVTFYPLTPSRVVDLIHSARKA